MGGGGVNQSRDFRMLSFVTLNKPLAFSKFWWLYLQREITNTLAGLNLETLPKAPRV